MIHFGTHGALEFMPGKQVGLSSDCWPDRLIGELPNIYIYSVNNPSEGSIAKRRSYAELISYLTPPIENAGLYKELADLKDLVVAYRVERERTGLDLVASKTAAEDGRHMVVSTVSDCDPSGWQMPISIARKLQAFKALGDVEETADLIRYYCRQMEENNGFQVPMQQLSETEKTKSVSWKVNIALVIRPTQSL